MPAEDKDFSDLKIFISYSRDDLEIADQIDPALRLVGFDPILDRQRIQGGGDFRERLANLIRDADTIVFLLSPSSDKSKECEWEVDLAIQLGKRIIPVIAKPLGDYKPPEALRKLDYIFFYPEPKFPGSGFGSGLKRLVEALHIDSDWIRTQTWLLTRAMDWQAGGERVDALLVGQDTSRARGWLTKRPNGAPPPLPVQIRFVEASEAYEKGKLETERARQEEMRKTLDEKEAAVKAREDAERRGRRVRHLSAGGATILILSLFGLMFDTASERNARRVSEVRLLAERAATLGHDGDETARLLLAIEARSDFVEAPHQQAGRSFVEAIERGLTALTALPDDLRRRWRTKDEQAQRFEVQRELEQTIESAINARREHAVLHGHVAGAVLVEPHPNGRDLISGDGSGGLRVWSLETLTLRKVLLDGHKDRLRVVRFHPAKKLMLTAADDNRAILWDSETLLRLHVFEGHTDHIFDATFSDDGSRIATASKDKRIGIWNVASGRNERFVEEHKEQVNWVRFVDDGRRLMSAAHDKLVALWNVADGSRVDAWSAMHDGAVFKAAISPDGRYLATASVDGWPQLWQRNAVGAAPWAHETTHKSETHEAEVYWVEFDPTSTHYVTSSQDETVRVWSVYQNDKPHAVLKGHTAPVLQARFHPKGRLVITGSEDRTARLWDVHTGAIVATLPAHQGEVHSVTFLQDGRRAATASEDGTVRIWDIEGSWTKTDLPHAAPVWFVRPGPGDLFATTDFKGVARVYSARSPEQPRNIFRHEVTVWMADFSPDGRYLATASDDNTAKIWSLTENRELAKLQHERWVSTVRFSPDGRFVVTASGDNTAKVFRVPSGELVHTLKGHDDYVRTAEFDARGLRILTSSYDGTARVYSAEDGRLITALSADKGQKLEFAKFSPDGRHAVGATNVGKGYLWCTDASGCSAGAERREFGQIVWKLWTHNGAISGVEFSSDGKRLATASHDRTARVWDVASGLETRILRGHGDRVNSIAFSLDDTGDRLLTTSADRSVRIWDTATGIEVERLQGHTEPVLIGVVLRGGMVVTAGRDRTARLWRQVPRDRITAMSAGVGAHGQATVPTDADVLTRGQMMATRCFSVAERRNLRLKSAVPPDWCIERRKWPFDDEKFRSWLKDRDKPFPDLE